MPARECDCCGDPGRVVPPLRRVLCENCARELLTGEIPQPPDETPAHSTGQEDDWEYKRTLASGWWDNIVRAMEG